MFVWLRGSRGAGHTCVYLVEECRCATVCQICSHSLIAEHLQLQASRRTARRFALSSSRPIQTQLQACRQHSAALARPPSPSPAAGPPPRPRPRSPRAGAPPCGQRRPGPRSPCGQAPPPLAPCRRAPCGQWRPGDLAPAPPAARRRPRVAPALSCGQAPPGAPAPPISPDAPSHSPRSGPSTLSERITSVVVEQISNAGDAYQ
ncbi:hypothetical protein ABZP36_015964 [Zizania latifolia]